MWALPGQEWCSGNSSNTANALFCIRVFKWSLPWCARLWSSGQCLGHLGVLASDTVLPHVTTPWHSPWVVASRERGRNNRCCIVWEQGQCGEGPWSHLWQGWRHTADFWLSALGLSFPF